MRSFDLRPVPGKFTGDVIVTPDCAAYVAMVIAAAPDGYALTRGRTPWEEGNARTRPQWAEGDARAGEEGGASEASGQRGFTVKSSPCASPARKRRLPV